MVWILFYWTWRDFGLLPTYPFKGSKFHVVLFQKTIFCGLVCFSFENSFEEEKRGLKGMRLEKVRLFQLLRKRLKLGFMAHLHF